MVRVIERQDRGKNCPAAIFTPRQPDVSLGPLGNKHKHFRRDGVRDKQEPSLGQMGPLLGTKWDPSLGQTGLSLFNSTVKSPFCPVCPWDRWGFVPGTIVPQGPSEKCLCVFCLLVFLLPKKGPARTKNSTESKFSTGSKFATAVAKRYGGCTEMFVFLGKGGRKTVQRVKNYGGSKILWIWAPYDF